MTSESLTYNQITDHFKHNFSALFFAFILCGALSACGEKISEHGHLINKAELATIEIGSSKRSDIVNTLGWPSFEGAFDKQKLYYVSQTMTEPVARTNTTTERSIYIFSFDAKNTLQTIDLIDEKSGVKIAHITAKTPTSGDQFGVLDQLFANVKRRQANN